MNSKLCAICVSHLLYIMFPCILLSQKDSILHIPPSVVLLYPRLKQELKGKGIAKISDIHWSLPKNLKEGSKRIFAEVSNTYNEYYKKCIALCEKYFEGNKVFVHDSLIL